MKILCCLSPSSNLFKLEKSKISLEPKCILIIFVKGLFRINQCEAIPDGETVLCPLGEIKWVSFLNLCTHTIL